MTADAALKHSWLRKSRESLVHQPLDPEVLSSLRDFSNFSNFKRTALEAVAFGFSGQSIRHLREQFAEIDTDCAGFVSLDDFCSVLMRGLKIRKVGCYTPRVAFDSNAYFVYAQLA
jgi:hypothetical protein